MSAGSLIAAARIERERARRLSIDAPSTCSEEARGAVTRACDEYLCDSTGRGPILVHVEGSEDDAASADVLEQLIHALSAHVRCGVARTRTAVEEKLSPVRIVVARCDVHEGAIRRAFGSRAASGVVRVVVPLAARLASSPPPPLKLGDDGVVVFVLGGSDPSTWTAVLRDVALGVIDAERRRCYDATFEALNEWFEEGRNPAIQALELAALAASRVARGAIQTTLRGFPLGRVNDAVDAHLKLVRVFWPDWYTRVRSVPVVSLERNPSKRQTAYLSALEKANDKFMRECAFLERRHDDVERLLAKIPFHDVECHANDDDAFVTTLEAVLDVKKK